MPRIRGMKGPGSMPMGGGGIKPGVPHTPMAGRPPGGAMGPGPGAPPRGIGGAPMGAAGPPRPRPPAGPPVGLAGPAPGGAPPGAGGMGGSGGFKKGGRVEKEEFGEKARPFGRKAEKFAKGGVVRGGGDSKPRHKPMGPFK